ncbi:MAG: hypothetical protein ACRD45_14340 [Bryobacteraceae bacterium]
MIFLIDAANRRVIQGIRPFWSEFRMIGGIARQADGIAEELRQRLPTQRKTQRGKLALLVATMLHAPPI